MMLSKHSYKLKYVTKVSSYKYKHWMYLKIRPESAVATDLGNEGSQHRVDRGHDGAGEPVGDDELGQRCHNEDGGLRLHLLQRGVESRRMNAVDNLSCLHSLTRRDVEPGHITTDIGIANNRKELSGRHLQWRRDLK